MCVRMWLFTWFLGIVLVSGTTRADDCLVGTNNLDGGMSLKYLAHYGNITVELNGTRRVVGVSFCRPAEFCVGNTSCSGYMIFYDEGCGRVFLSEGPLQRRNKSVLFTLGSDGKAVADVCVECAEDVSGLHVLNFSITEERYLFTLASVTVCPGYSVDDDEKLLSKASIIAIVSAIVALVIGAAGVFQWKSRKRSGDDYNQLI